MKLSKRGEYALRALIDLGVAHEAGRGMVQVKEIVQKENIPAAFLEQIFVQLREAGYIAARRGKLGGYYLLKPPESIVMGEIVRLIDGSLAPIGCVSNSNYENAPARTKTTVGSACSCSTCIARSAKSWIATRWRISSRSLYGN